MRAIYRAALRLYPPAFRREFSAEMARDFDDAIAETRAEGGRGELAALWRSTGADLARTLIVEWLRTGLPVLMLTAAAGTAIAAKVAATVVLQPPLALPIEQADRDILTLLVLTCAVLLVICATIIFTFWFSRPPRRRLRD